MLRTSTEGSVASWWSDMILGEVAQSSFHFAATGLEASEFAEPPPLQMVHKRAMQGGGVRGRWGG